MADSAPFVVFVAAVEAIAVVVAAADVTECVTSKNIMYEVLF